GKGAMMGRESEGRVCVEGLRWGGRGKGAAIRRKGEGVALGRGWAAMGREME
ncbi:hypothetical protein HN51_037133, partial [Arachis hypogaea]